MDKTRQELIKRLNELSAESVFIMNTLSAATFENTVKCPDGTIYLVSITNVKNAGDGSQKN